MRHVRASLGRLNVGSFSDGHGSTSYSEAFRAEMDVSFRSDARCGARAEECRGKGPATVNRASLFWRQKAKERPAGVTGGFQAAGV